MDIKAKIEEIVAKLQGDKGLLDKFTKDPVKTVESLIGVDLPDDVIGNVVEGVKAKVSIDKAAGILDSVKNLFNK